MAAESIGEKKEIEWLPRTRETPHEPRGQKSLLRHQASNRSGGGGGGGGGGPVVDWNCLWLFSSFWFCSWAAGVYVLYKKRFSFFPLSFTVPLGANSLILVPHSCSAVPLLVFFWTFGFAFFFPPIATRPLRRVGGSRETAERSLTVRIYIEAETADKNKFVFFSSSVLKQVSKLPVAAATWMLLGVVVAETGFPFP